MKSAKEKVYDIIKLHSNETGKEGVTTQYISKVLNLQRTNVSSLLNRLVDEGQIDKTNGRPVQYFIRKESIQDSDGCFKNLVGYQGSLRRAVRLAKAAVLYPQKSLNSIIVGDKGTGKHYLAKLMHQFAIENGVISTNSKLVRFDCKEYIGNDSDALLSLFGNDKVRGIVASVGKGVLYIDNLHCLSVGTARQIASLFGPNRDIAREGSATISPDIIVIIGTERTHAAERNDFIMEFPIVIEMPALEKRPLPERMELITQFFSIEAARIKRTLCIKEELLRCLLLYDCESNCMQLKADIKIGCANAYVRELNNSEPLSLYISDFEHHVRQGFLKYFARRAEVEEIIPQDYSYSFDGSTVKVNPLNREKLKNLSFYDEINKKAKELDESGLDNKEIHVLLGAEVENEVRRYQKELVRDITNKEQLSVLVDKRLIDEVEIFLKNASEKLSRSFPDSVFYSICLHINAGFNKSEMREKGSSKRISGILDNYREEYLLATEFAGRMKHLLDIELSIDEVVMIAMLISYNTPVSETVGKPVILFAFYGDGIASSIAATVNAMTHLDNVFSFDLSGEESTNGIYEALKKEITSIHRGRGVIVIYDSVIMMDMLITLEEELGIIIRAVPIPIATIGIELSRKAAMNENIDTVYRSIQEIAGPCGGPLKRVIVALCTTGKGSAEELRKYIQKYGQIEDTKIITMAQNDKAAIRESITDLMKKASIHCIVGTYNPELYSLPFISISEVFSTPKEQLPALLHFAREAEQAIDVEEMLEYLNEQLELTDISKLRRYLPKVIEEIDQNISSLNVDTRVGLFIHISCCIERMLFHNETPKNVHTEMILSKYNVQFRTLAKCIKPLEKAFGLIFADDELANMLTIIYKL